MADPLSITASIIAVLQLTSTVVQYLGDVKDSSRDRLKIRDEISSTSFLLYSLKDRIHDAENLQSDENKEQWLSSISSLGASNGPLARFKTDLEDLAVRLKPSEGRHKIGKALMWTFEKGYINSLLQSIERQKSIFTIALQSDHIDLSIYMQDDIKNLDENLTLANRGIHANNLGIQNLQKEQNAFIEEGRRKKVYRWLAAPDPTINHEAASKKKQSGTGSWIVNSETLDDWKSDSGSFLWLFGIPGCGKTVLCSTIVEETIRYCAEEQNRRLAYFYFDFKETAKQSHVQLLRSLVKQLSAASTATYSILYDLYSQCLNGEQQPEGQALAKTLSTMITELEGPVYIIIDALDECGDRELLLNLLEEICAWSVNSLHVMITSRPEKEIRETVESLATKTLGLESALVEPDIRSYIRHTLEEDKRLRKWSSEVKDEVEVALAKGAHGMFRWVFCQLDDLRRCLKIVNLRKALKSLPKTLDETYARILQSIHEDYRDDARRILRWLAYSTEPMSLQAVAEVLAISDEDTAVFDAQNRLPDPTDILTICSSLINVTWLAGSSGKGPDENLVQLAHFSVKEYLVSDRVLAIPSYNFEIATEGQQHLARDCIAYLIAFRKSKVPELSDKKAYFHDFPLLPHASNHWHKYCRGDVLDTCVEKVAKEFLTGDLLAYEAASLLAQPQYNASEPLTFSCSVASAGLVKLLICEGADVNIWKGYPLRRAGDDKEIITLLLDAGADIDLVSGELAGTVLQRAAGRGSLGTVELLTERGANINLKTNMRGFALKDAALYPDQPKAIKILKFLLDKGADINLRDEQGTALTAAISSRSTEVAKLLIVSGADLELQDNCQRTALALATVKGLHRIAEALLAGGANIDPSRKKNERPLFHEATYYGYEKLVGVFLKHGADLNRRGGRLNQTAFEAAVQGYLDLGNSQTTSCNWKGVLIRLMSSKVVLDTKSEPFAKLIRAFRDARPPRKFLYFSHLEKDSVERWRRRHEGIFALIRKACVAQGLDIDKCYQLEHRWEEVYD